MAVSEAPHQSEAEERRVAEREDGARDVHHHRAAGEGDDHREQNRRDDTHGPRRVDEFAQCGGPQRRVVRDFVDGDGDGRAQQTENQRNGGRGGQTPRVVEVEQDDVGEHDAQIEGHHLLEGESSGVEHAAAGHLHHAARGEDSDDDADGGHRENRFHRGGFRPDGGVEEVDGVVRHADKEAGDSENPENDDDDGVDFAHERSLIVWTKLRQIFRRNDLFMDC